MLNKNYRSKNKIDKNFSEVISILNKNKISYWVCHGTLLGIIRDRKLIAWDPDIDIAVLQKNGNRKKISKLFRNKGFKELKKTLAYSPLTQASLKFSNLISLGGPSGLTPNSIWGLIELKIRTANGRIAIKANIISII